MAEERSLGKVTFLGAIPPSPPVGMLGLGPVTPSPGQQGSANQGALLRNLKLGGDAGQTISGQQQLKGERKFSSFKTSL